jgi:hypothetical protein
LTRGRTTTTPWPRHARTRPGTSLDAFFGGCVPESFSNGSGVPSPMTEHGGEPAWS